MVTKKRRQFEIRQTQKRRAKRKRVIHFVTMRRGEPFTSLKRLVQEGFKGTVKSNVFVNPKTNKVLEAFNGPKINCWDSRGENTFGDRYGIEMLTKIKRDEMFKGEPFKEGEHADVRHAFPKQIKKIFIRINPNLAEIEMKKRIEFYKKEFPKTPIVFL